MQIPIIKKVNELGYISVVADYDPSAPGFRCSNIKYVVSTLDYDGILDVATSEKVAGILTTSDAPVCVVAKVAKQLGLHAMSEETAEICTNKLKQRILFRDNNIGSPFFEIVDTKARDVEFPSFPCIVKPVDSSASRGVTLVHKAEGLRASIDYAFEYSKSDNVLVEQFVEGREFSVETFTQDKKTTVVAITEKHLLDNGYFVENIHIEPADVTDFEAHLIKTEVMKAIEAVGLDNAPSHTEVKLWNGKVYIIEMACRLGGDYITSDLVPLSTGIDMSANLVKISVGDRIDVVQTKTHCAAVQFINNFNYSVCKRYVDSNNTHIMRYEIAPYSDTLIRNSLDRLGYIIIAGSNRDMINVELSKIQ